MSGSVLSVAEVLERAADLVAPEGAWVQGTFGREGECYCVRGALSIASGTRNIAYGHPVSEIALAASLGLRHGNENAAGSALVQWNDDPSTTQAEVVTALREAAAKAKAEAGQ